MIEELPKRPFKNFGEFLTAQRRRTYSDRAAKFPCPKCDGFKRIVAPWATNCPVEGYKMADRIDCPTCEGTGEVIERVLRNDYADEIARWKERYDKMKVRRDSQLMLLRKLRTVLTRKDLKRITID